MSLHPKMRQQLKAKAHSLKPVVMLGNQGLTDAVSLEINRALNDHELIKVKIATHDRELRNQLFATITESLGAELVQAIGHIGVLYRKNITD